MKFKDKVALVTGAGSGIGKATAVAYAAEGAKVVVNSRTEDEIRETADEIIKAGGQALAVTGDISKPQDVQNLVDQTIAKFGRLDIVLANAGINGVWAPIEELTVEEFDKTIDINLKGTFLTIKYAVPHLKKQGGSVTVVASVNGTRIFSNTGATAYSTSKAGQVAMTKMLALELAKWDVRVNVICPGSVETEINDNTEQRHVEKVKIGVEFDRMIPLHNKPASSRQVADLALFLASDAASHITGTPIWLDGAQSLLQG
ncbi:MAG TPA: SDR family NAD(P)-dependent oxidoreductase [Tepidisphaeraceae bacterium]|jgi:NAD(P)-dependent dehydrogenase (short-subunit alcohol dehydrogenase family)